MSETLLEVRGLNKAFGMVVTAKDLDFSLQRGILTSIIGPNGAGKSTLINLLTGFLTPDSGEIRFLGQDITHEPIHRRVRQGLCRSFQVVNVFSNLTLFENVAIPVCGGTKGAQVAVGCDKRQSGWRGGRKSPRPCRSPEPSSRSRPRPSRMATNAFLRWQSLWQPNPGCFSSTNPLPE